MSILDKQHMDGCLVNRSRRDKMTDTNEFISPFPALAMVEAISKAHIIIHVLRIRSLVLSPVTTNALMGSARILDNFGLFFFAYVLSVPSINPSLLNGAL